MRVAAAALMGSLLGACPAPPMTTELTIELDLRGQPSPSLVVDQSARVLRKRLAQLSKHGQVHVDGRKLRVLLPAGVDPGHAGKVLTTSALLEFVGVDDAGTAAFATLNPPAGIERRSDVHRRDGRPSIYFEGADPKALQTWLSPHVPADRRLAVGPSFRPRGEGAMIHRTFLLRDRAFLTGASIVEATPGEAEWAPGQFHVSIEFDDAGRDAFARFTEANVQEKLAILLDGVVTSAPIIQEKIPGGRAMITLGQQASPKESRREATDLALVLRAGALPVPAQVAAIRAAQ